MGLEPRQGQALHVQVRSCLRFVGKAGLSAVAFSVRHTNNIPETVMHEKNKTGRNNDGQKVHNLLGICNTVLGSIVRHVDWILCQEPKQKENPGRSQNSNNIARAIFANMRYRHSGIERAKRVPKYSGQKSIHSKGDAYMYLSKNHLNVYSVHRNFCRITWLTYVSCYHCIATPVFNASHIARD